MLFAYNILQTTIAVLLLPFLLAVVLFTPKYRGAIWLRLGFSLQKKVQNLGEGKPRIWVHALSVGEVSSARALVRGIKEKYPDGILVFSASTSSGRNYAASTLVEHVDLMVPFPIDFLGSVMRFIRLIRPDLFVLIETDLWPNFLAALKRSNVPALLVNGRISEESFQKYRRFRFFWQPLFETFRYISMQTSADIIKMRQMGISEDRLLNLGNLKYGVLVEPGESKPGTDSVTSDLGLSGKTVWVAGSTHRGEEEVIIRVYEKLRREFKYLYLVIAPRKVERGAEISSLAAGFGFKAGLRSEEAGGEGDLLILDTLGELAGVYQAADLAFVGGSLVPERGHNPLEPAVFSKPVIFGPHMEDFAEIAGDLLDAGGAIMVADEEAMESAVAKWLADEKERRVVGEAAGRFVGKQKGVTGRHIDLIARIVNEGPGR